MRRILLVVGLLVAAVVTMTAATTTETRTGSIDVDKEVDGEPNCPDEGPCFTVVIDCADQVTRRQVYDGSGHLIEGPSTFHRIPADTVCTVVETVTGGAVVTYDPVNADTVGVVITPEDPDSDEDQRVHVVVTNTFCEKDEDDCQPPPTTTVPTTTSTTTSTTTTSTTTTAPPPPPTSSIPPPTTVPPPPTTDPPTTTVPPTTDPTTTTTTAPPPPTTDPPPPTTDPVTTTVPPELPRTGSDLRGRAGTGILMVAAGAALWLVSRKRTAA